MKFIIPEDQFNELFPNRNEVFTYKGLVDAASKHPLFLNEGTDEVKMSELIAFLANVSHETTGGWPDAPTPPNGTYKWGLHFVAEVGCDHGRCPQYSVENNTYPAVQGQTYEGRGAIQLSYNYNYGLASEAIFNDKEVLLNDPSLVATDPTLAWETAVWFWMTHQPPKPSCHDVMVGDPSNYNGDLFGETVNIINGGIECGKGMNAQLENRIGFYKFFAAVLSMPEPQTLGQYCAFLK
jgi:chitinase